MSTLRRRKRRDDLRDYGWSAIACIVTAVVATPLLDHLDLANIVMLFLLTVLLVAARGGRGPAIMASLLCVGLFDFFFVPPRFSFAVGDVQYLITLGVMLAVALITSHLGAGLRQQADRAARRGRETQALYELARELAGAVSTEQVAVIAEAFLLRTVGMHSVLLLPDASGTLVSPGAGTAKLGYLEDRLAHRAYERGEAVGVNALAGTDQAVAYLPLKAPMRIRGTLAVAPATPGANAGAEAIDELLPTVASLVAIVIERLHYVDVATGAEMEMASERLRNSILSALSHDVRTPLTALVGLADSLAVTTPRLPDAVRETAFAIRDQAARMNGMVNNLLDMARLQAGRVTLSKDWQLVAEVAGAAVAAMRQALEGHPVRIDAPADLPLVEFDAVLIERVLCNLLENAAKYSPHGSPIEIAANVARGVIEVHVLDSGPGFPVDRSEALFGMFVRGEAESSVPGTGLGLAICRAIVDAHGGTIRAGNRPGGGGDVTFTLPLGSPPKVDEEPDAVPGIAGDV